MFDLDHTLIPIDSDFSGDEFTMSFGWVDSTEFKQKNDAFYADYKNGKLDIGAYVRFATDAICRQGEAKSMAAREYYISRVVCQVIYPQAVELVRNHQTAGDATIIVTATNEFVTRTIASLFGVDELIAVELEREAKSGAAGWFNGNIRGTPSFKEEKVARVQAWLEARQLSWDQIQTTFYSDSINDLPLLKKVTIPVATNPDSRLRTIATERGWRILDLF
jgi:HAD superfamily hydrolase (TIGR01490 family)